MPDVTVNRVSLMFDGELEQEFRQDYFKNFLSHMRVALVLAIVLYSGFAPLDYWLFPQAVSKLWFIRFAVFFPVTISVYFLSFHSSFLRFSQAALSLVALTAGLGVVGMILIAPYPANSSYYAGLILVIFFSYTFFKLRFIWATVTCWLIVACYEFVAIMVTPIPVVEIVSNNFFFLGGNLIGMVASYSQEFFARRDFLQTRMLDQERRNVQDANQHLEKRVLERTEQLSQANQELRQEIRDRAQAEEALRASEQLFRSLSENAPDIIYTLNSDGSFNYINPAWERLMGYRTDEVLGSFFIDFAPPQDRQSYVKLFKRIRDHKEILGDVEGELISKDGRRLKFLLSGSPNLDAQDNVVGMVGILRDITLRKRTEEQLKYLAYNDELTDLQNRKAFYESMEDNVRRCFRSQNQRWSLLFIDLDRFKDINDTLGHDLGDRLLMQVARRIKDCIRKIDQLFRLGGDEFTIIVNNINQDIDASRVAQRILESLSRPFHLDTHDIYTSCSIGISVFPDDAQSVEVMVKHADIAMFAAKEKGNCARFYTEEMNERALERIKLEHGFRNAVRNNELKVFYQPMVNMDCKQVIGMEALLRWEHPELGMIPPNRFIPLAEETGAIIPAGEWVLQEACRQAKLWRDAGHGSLSISVNLSAKQFQQPDLVNRVQGILRECSLPHSCLQLEVTETCIMENPEAAIKKMQTLYDLGIRFAIDDFGTGYSSLNYLKRFPVKTLKIDRCFISDALNNPEDQEIIRTIISMANNLNKTVLAEGVEEEEQVNFLCGQGCFMMQGFLFGRPMPGEDFENYLNSCKNSAHIERLFATTAPS